MTVNLSDKKDPFLTTIHILLGRPAESSSLWHMVTCHHLAMAIRLKPVTVTTVVMMTIVTLDSVAFQNEVIPMVMT